MAIEYRTDAERLLAEQAVLAYREVVKAMEAAPEGRGLACVENAVLAEGRPLLQAMMQQAMSAHEEAQKGGPAAGVVRAVEGPHSSITRPRRS